MSNLDSTFKSRDITLPTKVRLVKAMVFPIFTYGCVSWNEESGVLKNWRFRTVVLKILERPLDCKEIQPVHSKGDKPWVFFGRNDAKAETPLLWPPLAKSWLIAKDSDAGWDWRQEEKRQQRMRWLDGITDSMEWVWVNSGRRWWTGRPGELWFMGLQGVGHDWATELNWTERYFIYCVYKALWNALQLARYLYIHFLILFS